MDRSGIPNLLNKDFKNSNLTSIEIAGLTSMIPRLKSISLPTDYCA